MTFIGILILMIYFPFDSSLSQAKDINEIVLSVGMSILVKADWATIEISAVNKNKRKYTWDGDSVIVKLIPRKERWYGSLGLYHPQVRPPHKGVVHMIVEEGQQHFQTVDDAVQWIATFGEKSIYSDDGLLISADLTGENTNQKFVSIQVWQIYIGGKTLSQYQEEGATLEAVESFKKNMSDNQLEIYKKINLRKHYIGGHKPTGLPGSQNSRITIK
jgi:hypothetical protein